MFHVWFRTQSIKLNEFEYIIVYLLCLYWSGDETIYLSKPDDHIQTDNKDYLPNIMEPWRKMILCLKGQANSVRKQLLMQSQIICSTEGTCFNMLIKLL